MNNPKFSIIIAAYNIGKLVQAAIQSCINQKNMSCDEYEVIVYNDGSTDDTLDSINKFSGISNIKIVSQSNVGLSATRNRGIEESTGDYILFLDGDDWLADDALSTLKNVVEDDKLIVFPMNYYFSPHNIEKRGYHLEERTYSRCDFLHATLGCSQFHIIPSQNKCYSRKILLGNGIRFVNGILHEDNPFFIASVYVYSKIEYIDRPLYYYRQNREGSITSLCTIHNYNGVMEGNKYIEELTGNKNKDVNFLLANLHIFQIIGNYKSKKDKDTVISFYRSVKMKKRLVGLLFTSTLRLKHTIRMILALIDPNVLLLTLRLL